MSQIPKTPGVADGKIITGIPTGDDVSSEDRVRTFLWDKNIEFEGWGKELLLTQINLVSATATPAGSTTFSWVILPEHCNRLGNAHGGCTSTIFDICTTAALAPIAKPGYWAFAGVSRTLNVTYLRPIPVGEEVLVESTVIHAGKRLSTIHGVIKRRSDGAVLATCEHGKVSIDPTVANL